ncbi:MAG TPA: hypothetical protein VFS88_04665 [Micavibrio sp.]|nr:hypothetical protein [Micavibrio sp.]
MIAMVETLICKGFAYESGGNVYFDVAEFPRYPEFARLNMTGQQATDRVDFDSLKRSQADFALWFSQSKFPNQVMKWDSPWGEGFPGWHIECSAMAMKYLGDRIDIHCGGIDHIPVHHTNEIAQSECCLDHDHAWVNYWMHGAFLTVDKEKMSKSKGDVLTVDKLAKDGFNPLSYRYLLMTTHYRGELRFNYDVLEAAESAYKTLFEKVQEWRAETPDENGLSPKAQEYRNAFWDAMRNDLHSPQALSVAWSVARADDIGNRDKLTLFREFDGVFALGLFTSQEHALSANEQALLDQREAARLRKDWQESDRLRDVLLNDHGVQIRDTKDGVEWVRTI